MFTRHAIKQLSAYCNGELSAEQSQRVREHLLACARCRKQHDEIKLGVQLAEQLPMFSAPDERWAETEGHLEQRCCRRMLQPRAPNPFLTFNLYRVAVYAAVLVVAVALAIAVRLYSSYRPTPSGPSWDVASLSGT